MNRSKVGLLSLILAAGLAACDDATGPGDSLSQGEAEALAQVILTQTFATGDPTSATAPGTSAAPVARQVVDFSNEVSVELPCALGGSVAADVEASGTIDSESGAANLQYSSTQTHQSCQVAAGEEQQPFTLNGAPNLTSTFQFTRTEGGTFETAGGISGAVEWESGDRSGTCVVSLEFSGSGDDQGSVSFSLSGGVCSAQISQQVSVAS